MHCSVRRLLLRWVRGCTVILRKRTHASILIVEDDKALRAELAELLREEGFKIAVASNGAEALRWLERGLEPSAILLDLTMPLMDGWEFRARQLENPKFASIPVILLSGARETVEAIAALGALGGVSKPFEAEKLLDLLDTCAPAPEYTRSVQR